MRKTFHDLQIGDTLPTMRYPVTPDWVETYLLGTQDETPWYHDSSPFGGPVAPPTITNADFDRFLRANNYIMSGVIPTKTSQEYYASVPVGTTLVTTCTIVDKSERKGRDYITFEFVTTDEQGRLLMKKRDTFLQLREILTGEA